MAIAIDAMGGDLYPQMPVAGAVQAVRDNGIKVVLVGDQEAIKAELDKHRYDATKVEIVHSTQIVEMDEPVVAALRNKKDSSMRVCYNLHKEGRVTGVVSAGSSGAMLAIGKFVLKTITGIDRPCISALLPSIKEKVLLLDAGANMDCSPFNLYQFAVLGGIYMKYLHGRTTPKIGLLNIGSEPGKGDELTKKTFELLQHLPEDMEFFGNVEGKEFFNGHIDVVVTDGFAGNVLLKSVQGAANYIQYVLKEEISKSFWCKLGAGLMLPAFKGLRKRSHYSEFGGAPLLGLKGTGIVCHGSSNGDAIQFGIRFAQWAAEANLVERMEEQIQTHIPKPQAFKDQEHKTET